MYVPNIVNNNNPENAEENIHVSCTLHLLYIRISSKLLQETRESLAT